MQHERNMVNQASDADDVLPWRGARDAHTEEGSFGHDLGRVVEFPISSAPSKLHDFLMWLETQGQVRMAMTQHDLRKNATTKSHEVSPRGNILYQLLQPDSARKEKPGEQNAGSLSRVAEVTQSEDLKHVMRWKYNGKKKEIEPLRPGVYLKAPVKVKPGMFVTCLKGA